MRLPALKLLAALALLASAVSLPAQDWAKGALEKSPRHREYVPIKHGDRTVQAFVVYPEVSHKAPVVLLIHEIFGLTDWAKLMADELAAQGFIVIAPDFLSGAGPGGGGTDSFPGEDAVTKAIMSVPDDQVIADLDAAADYGKKLPSTNGKLFVTGFCYGGSRSFLFATHRHDLAAAFVFYGTPPPVVTAIAAPVYGFYAGNDNRVSSTIPATIAAMKAAGKKYDPVTYDGAGHGFMRAGQAPDANDANKKAWDEGFKRLVMLINQANASTTASPARPPVHSKPVSAKNAAAPVSCHEATPAGKTASSKPAPMDMATM